MSRTITGNWNYPTNIKFGPGAINELANACRELGMTRPLLVTDEGLRELPMIRNALQANEAAGMPTGLFADVQGNPVGGNVDAGVAACKAGQHDGIIAFGGGLHKCAGMNFANTEMAVITALLFRNYDLELITPETQVERGLGSSRPSQTWVRFKRRDK